MTTLRIYYSKYLKYILTIGIDNKSDIEPSSAFDNPINWILENASIIIKDFVVLNIEDVTGKNYKSTPETPEVKVNDVPLIYTVNTTYDHEIVIYKNKDQVFSNIDFEIIETYNNENKDLQDIGYMLKKSPSWIAKRLEELKIVQRKQLARGYRQYI